MSTIVLTGGGTAGHVTPHLALLPEIKKHFDKIYYIGSSGIEKQIITAQNIKFFEISSTKLVRNKIFKNLAIPFKLIKAINEAKKVLKELNPSIVFSKGGFVSVPVVMAAHSLNIPIVCHESDLSMGLANKISSKYAKSVCTTFEQTAQTLGKKGVYSGSPIDPNKFNLNKEIIKNKLKIKTNLPIILVTGGSLGSVAINNCVYKLLPELTLKYYIIHVTGKGNTNDFKNANYMQIEFTSIMPELITISDLVISRAGSNTIFELAFAKKPMLLIPLPKGNSRGDQVENANYFKSKNYANVLTQENLTPATLKEAITATIARASAYQATLANAHFTPATKTIIAELLKYKKD